MSAGHRLRVRASLIGLTALTTLGLAGCDKIPTPQASADTSTARQLLGTLVVENPHPQRKYVRTYFKIWDTQGGSCDTRETVLKRQGQNVKVDSKCRPVSGSWLSPYDDKTWPQASDVDIDHLVPLGEAWAAGAWAWTPKQREAFANDLTDPQLIAVTDNLNEAKGDQTPATWKPPLASFWPTYAADWITVKAKFHLSITAPEKSALLSMIG